MTVVSSSNTITFAGDGVQNNFDFNFRIFKAEDLCAVVRDSEGREERLVAGSDFKIISGLGADSGGRVQYPVSGEPLPTGKSITLYREIPYTQELELVDNDPFSAQLLNEVFDRGVMRDQQLQEQLDRALKYEISTPGEDRLSTKEMMQTITTAKDDAVSARSGALEAEGNTRGLLVDAQAARGGAEAARDKAETARTAAEEARDSAIKIAVGDLSSLRSSVPVLSAPAETPEGTTVLIVISDHIEDGVTSYEINTLGFGTASISGNTISWTLENIDADILKSIEVVRRRRGELYSDTAAHRLLVKHISVQDGPTMVFADSSAGYPGATADADGVHAPAHSVGADNVNQVVSAKPEIVQTSGKLSLLAGTSESVLKIGENYTGPVVTDQGDGEVSTCVEDAESTTDKSQVLDIFGDGSCLSLYTFNDTLLDAGPYDRFNLPQEANCFVAGKFGKGFTVPSATPNIMTVGGTNMVPVDGARTVSVWVKFNTASAAGARVWNLQGGSDASTYTTDIGGLYCPTAGKVKAILNSGGFNSPEFDDPGDWFLMVFESSPETGGKIYVNNTLLMEGIAHVEANYAYRLYQATSAHGFVDQARIFNRVLTAEERAMLLTETVPGYAATLTQPLPGVPTKAVKKLSVEIKVGAGVAGEYLGPKKVLTLSEPVAADPTKVKVVSNESIKDQIFKADGLHKKLLVDDVEVEIESVSEVDNGDGTFTATITLKSPLAQAPTADTVVAIPDRCTLTPASYTYALDGDDLKITGAEIALEDNPALKRLALAVSGEGVTFKGGKIYIKEKP
ncbi:hypothetical protein [Desulfovibrio sp. JC022]|uniref:hypothetical protein n=1 Tax=Desulfovibrio sp. JC022 TaxID=2593642 RepID=UPI0013D391CB|nr:hypothetical protein [Desulfovibrio sp. JC022]NDV23761.1 hypothetical protein [Desulfovibrio sp. JC022]